MEPQGHKSDLFCYTELFELPTGRLTWNLQITHDYVPCYSSRVYITHGTQAAPQIAVSLPISFRRHQVSQSPMTAATPKTEFGVCCWIL